MYASRIRDAGVLRVFCMCVACVLHMCCDALHVCCMCVAGVLRVCCMCVACVLQGLTDR